jgi:hypothetical protein
LPDTKPRQGAFLHLQFAISHSPPRKIQPCHRVSAINHIFTLMEWVEWLSLAPIIHIEPRCRLPATLAGRSRRPEWRWPAEHQPSICATSYTTGIEIFAMAKFLNTSATNYFLEELIKDAKERLILISPFLKLNDRIKELLTDKNRLKIDVRIVYGKSELQPEEISWLKELTYIRTSFCKNLHAKCYLNEEMCIVTSLNLYEFSQVNNNEMGVLIQRSEDNDLYRDAYDEAQRIIRVSDEVRITLERVANDSDEGNAATVATNSGPAPTCPKCGTTMVLRTSKRGDTKGNSFWGCPGYPKCRSLISIES